MRPLHLSFLFGVVLTLLIGLPSEAGEPEMPSAAPTFLTGTDLRACVVAKQEFDKFGYDLNSFTVKIYKHPDTLEVVFIPNSVGDEALRTVGGRTSAGREVHYYVSTQDWKIVRQHFAR